MERQTKVNGTQPDALNGRHKQSETIEVKDFHSIHQALEKLQKGTRAKSVLLIGRAGQLITSVGRTEYLDITSFASLSAADFAATKEMASLIGEKEFSDFFRKGKQESIYYSLLNSEVILAVLFDKMSILGLIRVRVVQTVKEISGLFQVQSKNGKRRYSPPYWTTIVSCHTDWKK